MRQHIETDLHEWCYKYSLAVEEFNMKRTIENEQACTIQVTNALHTIKDCGSSLNFVRENNRCHQLQYSKQDRNSATNQKWWSPRILWHQGKSFQWAIRHNKKLLPNSKIILCHPRQSYLWTCTIRLGHSWLKIEIFKKSIFAGRIHIPHTIWGEGSFLQKFLKPVFGNWRWPWKLTFFSKGE